MLSPAIAMTLCFYSSLLFFTSLLSGFGSLTFFALLLLIYCGLVCLQRRGLFSLRLWVRYVFYLAHFLMYMFMVFFMWAMHQNTNSIALAITFGMLAVLPYLLWSVGTGVILFDVGQLAWKRLRISVSKPPSRAPAGH
ncbi:MAG: hypothetical protein K2Q33_01790 [Gammaproteobacteria bacterium]|nr:hypothetical protein [Gammaproteobacteria bacterium]